jgi:hypothetical protein
LSAASALPRPTKHQISAVARSDFNTAASDHNFVPGVFN